MGGQMRKIVFGIVGAGWRAEFFLRVASARPDLFEVPGVVVRNPEKAAEFGRKWGITTFGTLDALIDAVRCDFVVTSVPRLVNPNIIMKLVGAGIPVLTETPPAADLDSMVRLYEQVSSANGRVQVAEQYHLQPHQAARLAVVRSGRIGTVSQAQISVSHGYHGISLIRRYLGVGFESPFIQARSFTSPMIEGPGRDGPPGGEVEKNVSQTIGWINFGDRLGVFDFTGAQYFGWIRSERVLVRGDRGEIVNNSVSYLKDFQTPIKDRLERFGTGVGSDLEGYHLKGYLLGGESVYTNPLQPARLSGDEIAVGSCLIRMKRYVETGDAFYSLAEGCQDHYLSILLDEAVKTEETVRAETQPWCVARHPG